MGCFVLCTERDFEQIVNGVREPAWVTERLERGDVLDLSKGAAWGKFSHSVVEKCYQLMNPDAAIKTEHAISVTNRDGTIGNGYVDIYDPQANLIVELKTDDLDRGSRADLVRYAHSVAEQVDKYRWSEDIPGRPEAVVAFQSRPDDPGRETFVENFLTGRGIHVIWGGG
jgi:hypothetical protein